MGRAAWSKHVVDLLRHYVEESIPLAQRNLRRKLPSLGVYTLTSTALFGYLLLAGEPFPLAIEPLLSGCMGPNPDSPPPGSRAAAALLNEGVL